MNLQHEIQTSLIPRQI